MTLPGRATVSLTLEANEVVTELCSRFPLDERMDAAKLGLAYAVRQAMTPSGRDREPGAGTGTTWGVGSFDTDGSLRNLIRALFPESGEDPYILIEALMNRGLVALRNELAVHPASTLTDLASLPGFASQVVSRD